MVNIDRISSFAAHKGKMLPEETIILLIKELATHEDWKIFLFGGKAEKEIMEKWASEYPNVSLLAGKLKLDEELALMSHLTVMISMDSANMHLASLTNTPVVSVWGQLIIMPVSWDGDKVLIMQWKLTCRVVLALFSAISHAFAKIMHA